jgi:dienelactone hydrolase
MRESGVVRRTAWAAAAILLAAIAMTALWLADHARPRHEYFLTRRGTEVSAMPQATLRQSGGYLSQAVELRSNSGLHVQLRVLRPGDAAGPVPVVVVLAGHRTGRDAVDLIGDPGHVAMVALDYPYHGPEDIRSKLGYLRSLGDFQTALLDTPPAASVVLDWLEAQSWADTSQAELIGISFGAPFVAVAGALDERFRRVWIIHGGAGNRGWIEHNLRDRIPQNWLRPLAATLLHLVVYGASFNTAEWVARIAPRPVVVIGARDDERLPERKVEALFAAAGEPKELIWTEGGHVDPGRPELVRQILDIVRAHLGPPQVDAGRDSVSMVENQ